MRFHRATFIFIILFFPLYGKSHSLCQSDTATFKTNSFSGSFLFGNAPAASIYPLSGPYRLAAAVNTHLQMGFKWSHYGNNLHHSFSAGIKINAWFQNYRYFISPTSSNALLFDADVYANRFYTFSSCLYGQYDYRKKMNVNNWFHLFAGIGVDIFQKNENDDLDTESWTSASSPVSVMYLQLNNASLNRLRFQLHGGVGEMFELPWSHICSLNFTASWGPGNFAKGNYSIVPGTLQESKGTYSLQSVYAGLELEYFFTRLKKH